MVERYGMRLQGEGFATGVEVLAGAISMCASWSLGLFIGKEGWNREGGGEGCGGIVCVGLELVALQCLLIRGKRS